MKNIRRYGKAPFTIAVIHGGPGGPGTLETLAQEISKKYGVLEPLQTKATLEGQLLELKETLEKNSLLPVTLIGHSWGAMLSFMFAAQNPGLVKKLILVASGLFENLAPGTIEETRLARLPSKEKEILIELIKDFYNPEIDEATKDKLFAHIGELTKQADSLDLVPHPTRSSDFHKGQARIFSNVWNDVQKIRSSGLLLNYGKNIQCPVVAIHGDYDPHPAHEIKNSLQKVLNNFSFVLLKKCGHYPWLERNAYHEFYQQLYSQL